MSILQFPRIYFKGGISWDPGLGNNAIEIGGEGGPITYDPVNVTVNPPFGRSLAEHKEQYPQESGWNHFGTHDAKFENILVTGWSPEPGIIERSDGLVGQSLNMTGKLVDTFPSIDQGTQVFFDNIQLGDAFTPGFKALRRKRMLMRYLNFNRNSTLEIAGRAGAVWEVCFTKSDLQLRNTSSSSALQALESLLPSNDILGLAMRFHTYRTLYYRNGLDNNILDQPRSREELRKLYKNGKNFSNPAHSLILGVISPWTHGESEGHPGGRTIMPLASPNPLGPTFVEVDRHNSRITADFGETVPEVDEKPTKDDLGVIEIVVGKSGQRSTLARLEPDAYNTDRYEESAGLIDLDTSELTENDWDLIESEQIHLVINGSDISSELKYVVVAEDKEIYLDQGDTVDLKLKVFLYGLPAPEGTKVSVALYPGGQNYDSEVTILDTDLNGEILFTESALKPSLNTYVFYAFDAAGGQPAHDARFDGMKHFHINVRTLPFDDELASNTPDTTLTWQWIYENILAVYDVVNPVMSRQSNPRIGRPLHDRQTMETYVSVIRTMIDKNNFENTNYMPVTRELSNGKRELLLRWCKLVEEGANPQMLANDEIETYSFDPRV